MGIGNYLVRGFSRRRIIMEPELKFERALERLEKIVEALESGNLPLEEALEKYEEGVRLSRLCAKKLEHVETKIETLSHALNHPSESKEDVPASTQKRPPQKMVKKQSAPPKAASEDLPL